MKPGLFCVLLLAGNAAFAAADKVSPHLRGIDADAPVDVIVQFKRPPTEAVHQRMRSKGAAHRAFRGIAPNANPINVGVLDAKGYGTDSRVIAAIRGGEVSITVYGEK